MNVESIAQGFQRPEDWYSRGRADPTRLYVLSYLVTRAVVGVMALVLPFVLVAAEPFIDGTLKQRGSISAYYNTPLRDMFVATACVIGILLITYMAGHRSWEFRASLIAGVAVIGLALVPTDHAGPDVCGVPGQPADCAPIPRWLGESASAGIHYGFATVFLVSLAVVCVIFGLRERLKGKPRLGWFHFGAAIVIAASLLEIVAGVVFTLSAGPFATLYLGEMVTVLAFGASWTVKGWEVRKALWGRART
jgi:hypothetical protein